MKSRIIRTALLAALAMTLAAPVFSLISPAGIASAG